MYHAVVVDDETLICDAIRTVLESAVPEVRIQKVFHDGAAAYAWLEENRTDILLLDIEIPSRSGLDIAKLADSQGLGTYVVLISAHQDFAYAKKAIDYHVSAFLTKPFSSQQLIDAVRLGIRTFERRNQSRQDHRSVYRKLLQALASDRRAPLLGIRLCEEKVPIETLLCTQVELTAPELGDLSPEAREVLTQSLLAAVEEDSSRQSVFLMESEEPLRILVFSRGDPDLSWETDALRILSCHTGSTPTVSRKTYSSFHSYRNFLAFQQRIELFFQLTVDAGPHQAQQQLAGYIRSLNPEDLALFVEFLRESYGLCASAAEPEVVLQSLDSLLSRSLGTGSVNYIVDAACKFIQKHYTSSALSLKTVADELSVSDAYLSRLFKKHIDQNFSSYLLELRMSEARRLLLNTNASTVKIAGMVGFDNPAYFRASFKSYFGVTPSQFRQLSLKRGGEAP